MSKDSTILIVDDLRMNVEMLSRILIEEHTVAAAVSGENAIKLMKRMPPDLVLLDVSMPGIGGFDVLKFMKEQPELSNIPVIFVTGANDDNSEEKGLLLGAVDYIKKPYNADVIRIKVKTHLEMKAYRDNLKQLVDEQTKQLMERTRQLSASHEAIIMGMSLMSDSHDKVTGGHIERIKEYTRILTQKMMELYPNEMTPDLANQIVLFSPLHDVGKVCISDAILKKEGSLTPEEYSIMKTHSLEGAELLRKTELFLTDSGESGDIGVAIEIARSHHEKFDGTGYPDGLKGLEIPLSARIVAIADIYDALRSDRPYKNAFTHEKTVELILSGDTKTRPSHFDPKLLEIFSKCSSEFEKIFK